MASFATAPLGRTVTWCSPARRAAGCAAPAHGPLQHARRADLPAACREYTRRSRQAKPAHHQAQGVPSGAQKLQFGHVLPGDIDGAISADARSAMAAGSLLQSAIGRLPGARSRCRGVQRPGRAAGRRPVCPAGSRRRAVRSPRGPARIPPAASQMRAAPDPRILTGWSGASPVVLRFPLRAFLRFPVCPPGSPPSPAVPWFPFVRRSPVRRLRPLPGSGSPFRCPCGFPFPGQSSR